MAYYTAFINAWNSPIQPPTGVSGTGLTAGMTTSEKLGHFNAWTVLHAIPALVTSTALLNAIVAADFSGLGVNGLSQLQIVVTTPMVDISAGNQVRGILANLFTGKVTTLNNITALAAPFDNATQPWWLANGYSRPFDLGDCTAAGVV